MTHSFHAFEAALVLGSLLMALRAIGLERSVGRIRHFGVRITELLRAGRRDRALALCDEYDAAILPPIARRVTTQATRLRRDLPAEEARRELERAFEAAYATQDRRVQSARARDLIGLAFVAAVTLYAGYVGWLPSLWSYAVIGGAVLLLGHGVLVRQRLLAQARRARADLIGAAATPEHVADGPHLETTPGRCPTCGGPYDPRQQPSPAPLRSSLEP